MELHSVHNTFHHLGQEKRQMLDLNRRLETYLSRVKLLEEENAVLAEDIQTLRRSNRGPSTRRKGLEDELRQARLEVDAAWRDRVLTELEASRMTEELRALDQQRQREAQAQVEAKMKLERSRKELAEEQRAQVWLREKVRQLEHEMRHLIQTHQEDVAHMETTLSRSRAAMPPTLTQRGDQRASLLHLGQEYSHRASRAWQEAAEDHQGQIARLEESLQQTRSRLTQVGQEKSESQLRLQALKKEMASAQDVRKHLEKTVDQQGQKYHQEVQQVQEHLEDLQAEKEQLGRQMEDLVLENRGLLQAKASLGLEVATYRALLDSESFRGDVPRNISIKDAVFSPRGIQKNYPAQLSTSHKTTSLSSVRGSPATPVRAIKPVTFTGTPKTSTKPAEPETPYPKIQQDGAFERFRPQEVLENVTYAEPLSPPNEQEVLAETSEEKEGEGRSAESVIGSQVESGLSAELHSEDKENEQFTTGDLKPYHVKMTEESCGLSDESEKDVAFQKPAQREDVLEPPASMEAWLEKETEDKEREENSETEAVIEPNAESRSSSPASEPEGHTFTFSQEENILKEDAVEVRQERSCSTGGTTGTEDKLYPDGEEMDTWDSVMERKVDPKADDDMRKDEGSRQHAEPEEDISMREQERGARPVQQNMADPTMDTGVDAALDQDYAPLPDEVEDDEEDDSQNVSVSWRTELEGDSYAQDNTLADTRPLIRYKSDETHASHMEDSESSEGEQDKKNGEAETWSEGKSKRFGTMEDLCEDVEGEESQEEYDLVYTDVDHGATASDTETEEKIREVSEGRLEEEPEELTKPTGPKNVDYNEEADRLVEQELENLATDKYSARFAQQQSEEILGLQCKSTKEMSEEGEAGNTEDVSRCRVEPDVSRELITALRDQPYEDLNFPEDQLREEEAPVNEYDTSTHETEDHSSFSDFFKRPNTSEEPNSVRNLQDLAVPTEASEVIPVEASDVCEEHLNQDAAGVPETAEWEVLENPSVDFEIRDQDEECDEEPESADHHDVLKHEDEPIETSPDSVPDGNDIFVVEDSTEVSETNDLQDFFSSGVKNDFWVSSLETGATFHPEDTSDHAAEQANQNRGFADNLVWGDLENPQEAEWSSRMDMDSSKGLAAQEERERTHLEVKQVHSEESWSSGEEPL